jgi:hypothetical protein
MSNAQIAAAPPAVNPSKQGKALKLIERLQLILGTAPARGAKLRAMVATVSELRELIEAM